MFGSTQPTLVDPVHCPTVEVWAISTVPNMNTASLVSVKNDIFNAPPDSPGLHSSPFVATIILLWLQALQKRDEFLAGVPSGRYAVHLPGLHIQRSRQRKGPV